jgi:tRNA(Ile)-lysidine synthase
MEEKQQGSSLAARNCRYAFFEEVMQRYSADYLALAHHGDDQIETILMRLVRGTSSKGIAGILPKRPFSCGEVIRPLLSLTKTDLEDYCNLQNIEPRIDPSNQKNTYTRNRFRNNVLPFIKKENPIAHVRFNEFSRQQVEDEEYLMELTKYHLNTVIKNKDNGTIIIDILLFQTLAISLQRRCIQLILDYIYEEIPSDLSSTHIRKISSLLREGKTTWKLDFPKGLKVYRSYNELFFTLKEKKALPYEISVEIPSTVVLPNGMSLIVKIEEEKVESSNDTFCIPLASISLPIIVRTRKDGDRMSLKGMNGSKKIKDIFINEKVHQSLRDVWPIIIDQTGSILWVPLVKKSAYEQPGLNQEHSPFLVMKVICESF